jgi:hypothetical protein
MQSQHVCNVCSYSRNICLEVYDSVLNSKMLVEGMNDLFTTSEINMRQSTGTDSGY